MSAANSSGTVAASMIRQLLADRPGEFSAEFLSNGLWRVFSYRTKNTSLYNVDGTLRSGDFDFLRAQRDAVTWMCAHGYHGSTERRTLVDAGGYAGMYTGKCAGTMQSVHGGSEQLCVCACHNVLEGVQP